MRIFEIVNKRKISEQTDREELLNSIDRDCKQYLAEVRTAHKWLLRGHSSSKDSYIATTRYRNPKTSNPILSKLFDQALMYLGFTALRSTSIFGISSVAVASMYDTHFI